MLLAKAIDGIYDSDPKVNKEAKKYEEISIQEIIDKKLMAVDLTASILSLIHIQMCIRDSILSEIEQTADRIAIIVDGSVHYEGAISERDNLEELFMDIVKKGKEVMRNE